ERLFQLDSEAALAILALFPEDARADVRWRLALCGVDQLLNDLGLGLGTRQALLRRLRASFAAEFRADGNLQQQLGERVRKERKELGVRLASQGDSESPLAAGRAVLRRRSERLAPLLDELRSLERSGRLSQSLDQLAASYVHMHANRLLRSAQRAHEMVLYDFLFRLYESQVARG